MKRQNGFEDPQAYRGGLVAIGNFDGVHLGHQSMIRTLVDLSRESGVPAVALTFDPHPIKILRPDQTPPSLSTLERKAELLDEFGVDCLIVCPTDRDLLNLTPDEFFERIILRELNAKGLVEGENFCFGRDRSGDISTLRSLCRDAGLTLEVVPSVLVADQPVSSSVIRSLIAKGELAAAVERLGHPYRLQGRVAEGSKRGKQLGFPTANLQGVETLFPADGVYAGLAHVEGQSYPAAVNVGPNPTFGETARKLEVHLIDYAGDIYGRTIDVDLYDRVRDTTTFPSAEELQRQVAEDVAAVRAMAKRFASL